MRYIFILECSRCRYIMQISGSNETNAKHTAGTCPDCASNGVSWSTWQTRAKNDAAYDQK